MSAGLKVWDASGNLVFDTPDRMGRIVGSVNLPAVSGFPQTEATVSLPLACPSGTSPWMMIWSFESNVSQASLTVSTMTNTSITYTADTSFTALYGYF